MKIETVKTVKGELSHCIMDENEIVCTISEFLDLIMSCPTNTIVIPRANITEDFFRLKTGVAGEFLQKISNYRKRLVILGHYQAEKSKPLNDFIYESNKNGQVVFAQDINSAIELLK